MVCPRSILEYCGSSSVAAQTINMVNSMAIRHHSQLIIIHCAHSVIKSFSYLATCRPI